jgi:hypothetical protein
VDAARDNRRQLGQLMVEEGFLTPEQLAHALAEQSRTGRPLGSLLVELGFVSAGAVGNALAEQHGGLLKTEFGISAGLQGSRPALAPAPPPPDPAEARIDELESQLSAITAERDALAAHLQAEQAGPEPPVEHAHLLFAALPDGYTLIEWPGPAPGSGTLLDVDGVGFVVSGVGCSPFPGSLLRCAFLDRV